MKPRLSSVAALFGIRRSASLQSGEGLLEDSNHRARPAPVVEGGSKIRLELDGLVVVVDRVIVVALAELGVAAVEVSFSRRLELDRLVVIRDGTVVFAFLVVGHAAVVVGAGEFGVELDRLVIVRNGAVIVAFEAVADAAIVESLRELVALVARRPDDSRTTVDALIDRDRVLALPPAPLLRRLCERRGAGKQDTGQDRAQTLCCRDSHRQLHRSRRPTST